MSTKLFLSYAKEDIDCARRLCRDLRPLGLQVWFDEDCLAGGQDWLRETTDSIRRCDFFLALLSKASVTKRGVVQREVREALRVAEEIPGGQAFIVPVRVEECEPSYEQLKRAHWIDLFPDWTAGIRKIHLATSLTHELTGEVLSDAARSPTPGQGNVLMSTLVRRVLQRVYPEARELGIELILKSANADAAVEGDEKLFVESIYSLILGVLRTCLPKKDGEGVILDAEALDAGDHVEIRLRRLLPTLTGDEAEAIFSRTRTALTKDVGMGFGLFTARAIVRSDRDRGRLEISKPLEPTVFKVILPKSMAKANEYEEETSPKK